MQAIVYGQKPLDFVVFGRDRERPNVVATEQESHIWRPSAAPYSRWGCM